MTIPLSDCDMDLDFLDTYGAALAAIFGGIGVKVIDKMLSKRSEAFLESTKIREELRTEINTLRTELIHWKEEADQWREKYYKEVEEALLLKSEIEILRGEMERLKLQFPEPSDPSSE